jgi:hypothetical protein
VKPVEIDWLYQVRQKTGLFSLGNIFGHSIAS